MADRTTYILFAGERAWQVCIATDSGQRFIDVPLSQPTPQHAAERVGAAMHGAGYRGESTLLAVPARWSYAASVKTADLPKRDRNAMIYRLEESLPFAAENLVADFIDVPHAAASLGVCCELSALTPILAALEERTIAVQSIAPADILAAQGLNMDGSHGAIILLCAECEPQAGGVNVLGFEHSTLARWSLATSGLEDLKREIGLQSIEFTQTPAVRFLDVDGIVLAVEVGDAPTFEPFHAIRTREIAANTGRKVLLGQCAAWVEFRRGPLALGDPMRRHRRALNAALAAAVLLLLATSCGLFIRAQRYKQLEALERRWMSEAFAKQFPGWTLPANVRVIVESEHRKAAALASGTLPPDVRRTALQTLLDVLGQLPSGQGVTVDKLTFDDASFEMQGETGAFEQLDAVASAIRQSGMDVPAPEGRRLPGGRWSFVVRGSYPSQNSLPKRQPRPGNL